MKRLLAVVALIGFVALLGATDAQGQRGMKWRGSGGWGSGSPYGRMYNPKTIVAVKGEVLSLDTFMPEKGMSPGVHLTMKTGEESLSVHLGPEWYISGQDTRIAPGDTIEVKGSKITFDGKPALIAAQITKGQEVLHLRDDNGYPVWAGWRRRR